MTIEESQLDDWRCPACNNNTNSQGVPFSGSRAVALHVAGKIKTGDNTHRKWATNNVGEIVYDTEIYRTINTLADEIESYVKETNQACIREEKERIQRAIEERDANEEPRVLAYRYIESIETNLHQCVCQTLKEAYGQEENEWWVKGVPTKIRVECAQRREESLQREELYNYTNLIHLKTIIEKDRKLFEPRLRLVGKQTEQQKEFLDGIERSNDIRNRVMYTARMLISKEDISFLRQFRDVVQTFSQ